jgi:hypothetical protein
MPDWKDLDVAFRANQDTELRLAVGRLMEDLEAKYILVERSNGQWAVLCIADLAWLPFCKTLADLERYFVPSFVLNADGQTDDWIASQVAKQRGKIALVYRNDNLEKVIMAPPEHGPGDGNTGAKKVRCLHCGRVIAMWPGQKLCPRCMKELTK